MYCTALISHKNKHFYNYNTFPRGLILFFFFLIDCITCYSSVLSAIKASVARCHMPRPLLDTIG